ncbi:MAG: ABC transporter permease [Deltaproteobacteria bacterium]|jgi:NitT/TauT family transport system permease protein|nr:ABC transporter permease [Deltaproteobacteria bacterium]
MGPKAIRALVAILVFLIVWRLLAQIFGPGILPTPEAVIGDFGLRLSQKSFLGHLKASFYRATVGFFLGLTLAVPLGWLMGWRKKLDNYLSPLLFLTYPAPKVLFLPVLIVTLGLGEAPKIVLVAVTVGYQVLVVTRDSVLNLDKSYYESFLAMWPATRSSGAKSLALVQHILWPASLPAVATAMRLASGTAVSVLFMAESFATDLGLGYFIVDAWGNLDLPRMFSGILAMGLLGGFFYLLANLTEKTLCPWVKAARVA